MARSRKRGPDSPARAGAPDVAADPVATPQVLLMQQLHQVQEELERYYLKCIDLDADLQLARVARDDAVREAKALRMQLGQMQRELVSAASAPRPRPLLRRLAGRLLPRSPSRHDDAAGREMGAQLAALRESEWFDSDWYLATYEDVRAAGMDPVAHYHEFGWKEGRNPGPAFDTTWYLGANPDIAASGLNPLWHFIRHGAGEGRLPRGP